LRFRHLISAYIKVNSQLGEANFHEMYQNHRNGGMMEFQKKQDAMRSLMAAHRLDALLLRRVSSFAWATCGAASYVNTAATEGAAALLVTRSDLHLITDNIEATRLEQEEKLKEQGWQFHVHLWHEMQDIVGRLTGGLRLGADGPYPAALDLSGEMSILRARLTAEEGERFRELGRNCAAAMDAAARGVQPGQSEYEIAALLAGEAFRRGAQPVVNLIATDERIFNFRHPLPTHKRLERYAMLVLCGRQRGLVCSITRLVHFGQLPDEVRQKAQAVAQVDAAFIAGSRPGRTLGDVLQDAIRAYAHTGFAEEWNLHHQGGLAGYEPREVIATPGSALPVTAGNALAWNPSITGAKSEDTILVGEQENEILTIIPGWPEEPAVVDGRETFRPAILEIT
jgi:Xaa-Pro aminopeptidase